MKKERIMKNKSSRCPGSIRPMIYSIASALALMSGAANAAAGEFASVPLYLQNNSEITEQPKIKHNIMFFIDNSGSMGRGVPGGNITRMQAAKNALNMVLNKYQDKFNWGLQALVNTENDFSNPDERKHKYKNYTNAAETFNISWTEMQKLVNGMSPSGVTPSTRRYYEVVASTVMPNIKYRCQKSYVVMMSDGDANLSCNFSAGGVFHYRFNYDGNNNWVNEEYGTYPYAEYDLNVNPRLVKAGDSYRDESFVKAYKYFGPSPMKYLSTRQLGQMCTRRIDPEIRNSYFYVSDFWDMPIMYNGQPGGIRFFSQKLATKDIKTAADGVDAAGVSWDGDPRIDPKGVDYSKQLVQTFSVGFGSGISEVGQRYLRGAASRDDWYFNAAKPDDLNKAFEQIISQINDDSADLSYEDVGGTAPATTSSGVPDLAATIKLNTGSWSSEIQFNKLDKKGRPTGVFDTPSFGNRKTLINTTGSQTYLINKIPTNTLNNSYFGIADNDKNTNEWRDLLDWTGRIGSDKDIEAKSKNTPYSQTYRVRKGVERDVGDILDGSLAAIGDKVNNRQKYMVAAANDGMVHIFESVADSTSSNPYDLKVSYIPAAMERDGNDGQTTTLAKSLKNIAEKDYGKSISNHQYMVNGGFTLRQTAVTDENSNMPQRVFMFGAMGQGGRGAYALNIGGKKDRTTATGLDAATALDSDKLPTEVPLFETEKGEGNKLGYTIGTPQIGRISISRPANNGRVDVNENIRYAGFLASGYRAEDTADKQNETALYVYEMLGKEVGRGDKRGNSVSTAGTLLKKIEVEGGVGGLSTPTLLDIDFDGVVDVAYAGDRGGNMYRFDLRGEKPDNWTVTKIFTGSPSKPITSAPAVSRRSVNEYVVIFGTGSDLYQKDLTNQETQSIYGIYESFKPDAPAVNAATENDLQQQTISEENNYIYLTNKQVAQNQKGWKIDLRAGERVSIKPTMILRTAVVTVRRYESVTHTTSANTDLCLPTSNSTATTTKTSFIAVNADNGGALNERNARFTPDTVIRKLDGFGMQYANGLTQDGVINFTFINPSKLDDSPVTADGDSGGTGTDKELSVAPSTPNNRCFSNSADRSLLLNKGQSLEVKGRICGLQRISWRELFF